MRACLTKTRPLSPARPRAVPAVLLVIALMFGSVAPGLAQTPGQEDLRALLYYLDHDDQRSVQAEMRRLRAQFPNWTPPGDLDELRAQSQEPEASADVDAIWALIERGDYAEARALIDETRDAVPGWSPDADMLREIELNEGQRAFDEAVASGDHAAAVAAARRTPALMRCDRINNAWELAELYETAGQTDTAVATYRGVLGSCTAISDVVPTLEKADEVASDDQLTELFETARTTAPSNADELDELEARLRAGRGLSAPASGRAASGSDRDAEDAPSGRQSGETAPRVSAAPADRDAPVRAPQSGFGELPLRGDGRLARVRRLQEAGEWVDCLAQSSDPRSLDILYERGWCAYNLERPGEALAAFAAVARGGRGLGGTVARDANFGLSLAYLAFNMTEEAARVAAATDLERDQRVEVETIILDQRGVRAYHLREYAQAIAYFDALEDLSGTLRRDLAMLRAYAHMNEGDLRVAREQFTRLHEQLATPETRDALQSLAGMMSGG
ncbi:MAG: hypothetical protein HLUCCA12_04000 [Rhodobacteraceae bacterium HLUCCA12]|nr:MAG: hypothetical protein HLUCCA12_04000 [Rhodobacteraceae bacterium HLUCCA12]